MGAPGIRPVSVVIPAHNEEAVIGRCLDCLFAGSVEGELEVVVVCNGCDDRTAEVARRQAPSAKVLELPEASKVAALNAGDRQVHRFPRFYVDADVELPIGSLRRTAEVLSRPGVLCAAPEPSFNLDGRPWPVRAFYEIWARIPYVTDHLVGTGVYALSLEGRERFGDFPDLVNDDQFVYLLFRRGERRSVPGAHFVVHTPTTLSGLVAIRTRAYRGNRQLIASGLTKVTPPPSGARTALQLSLRPNLAPSVAVYMSVNLIARARARRTSSANWERDDSARSLAVAPPARGKCGHLAPPAVCYVMSKYPALSHTFVMREVLGLRAIGLDITTTSVHRAAPEHLLTEADRQEAHKTWNIFPLDAASFITDHWRAAREAPKAYFTTLLRALRASPPGFRRALWQLFYFAEAITLWAHARRVGARHLHAHLANVAADLCWLATEYANLAEPDKPWRWSFTMHGPTEFYAPERYNLGWKAANADAVLCISDFARSQLMYLSDPRHWAKFSVVHMGVELERYPYLPPPQNPGLHVLCVARLVPAKGLHLLIDAVAALTRRGRDVMTVVAGEGPLQGELEERAARLGVADKVMFLGAVGQDELPRRYAEADVFCLPSFAEGVPVVLMEAMATGRPVVATNIAGVSELVRDGVSGFLVPPGNVAALVDALERLTLSPKLRLTMGMEGRRRVERSFDSVRCAEEVAQQLRLLWTEGA